MRDKKIKIHKAVISDYGFDFQQANGTILYSAPSSIIVKTPTGSLELESIEGLEPEEFKIGNCLVHQSAVLL